MELLLLFIGCVFLVAGTSGYQPLGVPVIDAQVSASSVNHSVSYKGLPGVIFARYPLPDVKDDGSPGYSVWHSEVGLPQWIKIELPQPIRISEFVFTGRLSFEFKGDGKDRGKTHYRLEAVNPNSASPDEVPSCTTGWETLKEEDDAEHFSWEGDQRRIKVESLEAYSCYRLYFPEVPMDDQCRHFIIVSDVNMVYRQNGPGDCKGIDKPCECYKREAAFLGPDRKFVSWQMYQDDFNEQVLTYSFPQPETVFAFEFKTDIHRPQDGPVDYSLTGKNDGEEEVVLFEEREGAPFSSGHEVRRHRFHPKDQSFTTFFLRVRRVGWMVAPFLPDQETFGWVQVRDVKFYLTRLHSLNEETRELV